MTTTVSRIFAETWAILKSRLGPLLGLWGAYFAAQIALFVILGGMMGASMMGAASAGFSGMGGGSIALIFLLYVAYFLLALAQIGSLTAMASPLRQVSFGEALNIGIRSAVPLLGVLVVLMVAYFVCALVVGGVIGLLSSLGSAAPALALILVIPAVLYLMCRLCLIYAVVAVDRVGNPITAVSRTWILTRDNVLPIFGVMVVFVVAMVIVGGLLLAPMISSFGSVASGGVPNFGSMGFSFIGLFLMSIAISIASSALFAVIHGQLSDSSAVTSSEVFA